jgi:hypothetical protein
MNPKYDIYEEIDRYLNEELSQAELVQFHQKLSGDAEFKSIVEAQKIANEIIIDQEMIKLKERMNKEMNQDINGSSPWNKIILFSAAVVTSASIYTYIHYNQQDSTETKENVSVASSKPTITEGDRSLKDEATASIRQPVVTSPSSSVKSSLITSTESTPIQEEKTNTDLIVSADKENPIVPIIPNNEQEVKKQTPVVEQITKINCETVKITAAVRVDYGFDNDEEASIVIDPSTIKGGTAPYSYSLDHSAFNGDNRIDGIKDGAHHVRIKDHNNCITDLKKEVIVKTPVKEINEAFSPSHGERWKYPVKDQADATITIMNKAGIPVYSTNISGGYPNEWDGKSNAGADLESGNYYFVIQYSARDVVKGHINIVR